MASFAELLKDDDEEKTKSFASLLADDTDKKKDSKTQQEATVARRAEDKGITVEQQKQADRDEPLKRPPFEEVDAKPNIGWRILNQWSENARVAGENFRFEAPGGSSALKGLFSIVAAAAPGFPPLHALQSSDIADKEDAAKTAVGVFGMIDAPFDAAAREIGGRPLRRHVEDTDFRNPAPTGIEAPATEADAAFSEEFGTVGLQLLSGFGIPGALSKFARHQSIKVAKEFEKRRKAKTPASAQGEPLVYDPDFDLVFNENTIKTLSTEAQKTLKATPSDKRRQYLKVADAIRGYNKYGEKVDQIDISSVRHILDKEGMDLETFVELFKASVSGAGKTLAHQSHLARKLSKDLEKSDPELAASLRKHAKEKANWRNNPGAMLWNAWRETDSLRRLAGTSQLVTAVRNVAVAMPIGGIQALDTAVQKIFLGGINVKSLSEASDSLARYAQSYQALTKKGKEKFLADLDKAPGFTKEKLTSGIGIADATVEGGWESAKRGLAYFNMAQEMRLRSSAMQFKLADLQKVGVNDIDFEKLTPKQLDEALTYALQVTFANNPTSKAGKRLLQSYTNSVVGTLVTPYPRFQLYNAPRWFFNHSPAGALKLFMPKNAQALMAGDAKRSARIMAEASTGITLTSIAVANKHAETAGENNQELTAADGGIIKTLTFAPLSFYDIVADWIVNGPDAYSHTDALQIVSGMRSGRNTPLEVINEATDDGDVVGATKRLAGNYVAMMTTWFRQVKDVYSVFDTDETLSRDTEYSPEILGIPMGKTMTNIPGLSQTLPTRRTPFEPGPTAPDKEPVFGLPDEIMGVKIPDLPDRLKPVVAQFIPVTKEYRPALESALIKNGIEPYKMNPRTGTEASDDYVMREIGQMAWDYGEQFLWSDRYTGAETKAERAKLLKEFFGEANKKAKLKMAVFEPEVYAGMRYEAKLTQLDKDHLEQAGIIDRARLTNLIQQGVFVEPAPTPKKANAEKAKSFAELLQ